MINLVFIIANEFVRAFYNRKLECVQVFRTHESYGSTYDTVGFYDGALEPIGGKDILTKGQKNKIRAAVQQYYEEI